MHRKTQMQGERLQCPTVQNSSSQQFQPIISSLTFSLGILQVNPTYYSIYITSLFKTKRQTSRETEN